MKGFTTPFLERAGLMDKVSLHQMAKTTANKHRLHLLRCLSWQQKSITTVHYTSCLGGRAGQDRHWPGERVHSQAGSRGGQVGRGIH